MLVKVHFEPRSFTEVLHLGLLLGSWMPLFPASCHDEAVFRPVTPCVGMSSALIAAALAAGHAPHNLWQRCGSNSDNVGCISHQTKYGGCISHLPLMCPCCGALPCDDCTAPPDSMCALLTCCLSQAVVDVILMQALPCQGSWTDSWPLQPTSLHTSTSRMGFGTGPAISAKH